MAVRVAAVAAAAWLLWGAFVPHLPPTGRATARAPLATELARWSLRPPAETLQVALDAVPNPAERDWLAALRRVGHAIAWSHTGIPAAALAVERLPEPGGGVEIRVSAPARTAVTVADRLGPLDSVRVRQFGAVFAVPQPIGEVSARVGGQRLHVALEGGQVPRGVVIVGTAGWEPKFTIAALEERGWQVHARLAVAPGLDVTQGSPFPLDTARHGVVVALDSSAARSAAAIAAFVARGGGLVLAPAAARTRAFRSLAAGAVAPPVDAQSFAFGSSTPRSALRLAPIDSLAETAVVLERQDGHVAIAARRVGAGRVVQVGYEDTWHWRMQGADEAPESHSDWWCRLVATAAYRGSLAANGVSNGAAPLANLVGVLGPPMSMPSVPPGPRLAWPALVLAGLVLMLLGEWTSRRLRGAA